MTYFKNPKTLQELRKQYKELLKIHHPDNGGNLENMQNINAEYDRLFKVLKDKHESKSTADDAAKSDYEKKKWDYTEDVALREVLQKIIILSDITIEVCSAWIWVSGNTYQHKELLKEYGFKFGGQKKAWYWHSEAFQKRSKRTLSMNDIRNYYGSTEIETQGRKLLKEA